MTDASSTPALRRPAAARPQARDDDPGARYRCDEGRNGHGRQRAAQRIGVDGERRQRLPGALDADRRAPTRQANNRQQEPADGADEQDRARHPLRGAGYRRGRRRRIAAAAKTSVATVSAMASTRSGGGFTMTSMVPTAASAAASGGQDAGDQARAPHLAEHRKAAGGEGPAEQQHPRRRSASGTTLSEPAFGGGSTP